MCQCREGFTGYYCEDIIDDCVNANCEEYQVCVDLVNSHRCMIVVLPWEREVNMCVNVRKALLATIVKTV